MKPIALKILDGDRRERKYTKETHYARGAKVDLFVPPIDVTATSVDKIYPLDKIFTAEQYDTIYNEMTQKEFQLEFLKGVNAIYESRPFTKEQTVLAMFISGLYKLKCLGSNEKRIQRVPPPSYSSKTLSQYILKNFNVEIRKRKQKIRILCHALVLYMLINNFRVNLHEFAEEFDVSSKVVLRLCNTTGATVQMIKGKRILILKLPLSPRQFMFKTVKEVGSTKKNCYKNIC